MNLLVLYCTRYAMYPLRITLLNRSGICNPYVVGFKPFLLCALGVSKATSSFAVHGYLGYSVPGAHTFCAGSKFPNPLKQGQGYSL